MSTNRDFDRIAGAWLAEGPNELADRVLDAALDEVHLTHQRRPMPVPWRTPTMPLPLRLAAGIAIIAILGVAAVNFLGGRPGGVGAGPTPTPSPTAAPEPTPTPTPAPTPIDTATWTTYVSERYGFSIGHPEDWDEQRADHDWTFPADSDWLSTAQEAFLGSAGDAAAPSDGLRVSAWSVALETGQTPDAWLEAYCPATNTEFCTGQDRPVPVSLDGHRGSLIEFPADVQAFFQIDDRMYVVAAWRPEYREVLEAFLSTMRLLPEGPVPAATTPPPA